MRLVAFICLTLVLSVNGRVKIQSIEDISLSSSSSESSEGCTIAITGGLNEPQPLLLLPGTEQFFYPENVDGIIEMFDGEELEIFCSQEFYGVFSDSERSMNLTCNGNKFFVNDVAHRFNNFNCTYYPYHVARRTGDTCHDGASLVEVGFEVDNRFLWLMDICHDENLLHTHYTHYQLTPANIEYQHSFPRPNFIQGNFYEGLDINNLYTQIRQQETIGRIIGDDMVEKFWDLSADLYLARGHLAAKVDFIFGSQQRATFYFVNVAPQWQTFNGKNWETVESGSRKFISNRGFNADVYTGTFGVLELPDANGTWHDIYLHFDENNNGQVPVPRFYYKLIINTFTDEGIVIIGINNPHLPLERILNDYILCPDVSDDIDWLTWDRHDIKRGYMYACDVNDFVQVVDHLPDIRTTGLLI